MNEKSRLRDVRIAMWSGPRNISTAMMRAWGSRSDTAVCDEPLYSHYLQQTELEHPGRSEILEVHEQDWRKVSHWLLGPIPGDKRIFYQKHMAHHLLPTVGRDWLADLTHCFLIRDPREMLTSLIQVTPRPQLSDTGLPQQWELFERMQEETGKIPAVLDSRDVLENPRGLLEMLCRNIEVPFQEAMLTWQPGRRDTDGIWAKHWYRAVEASSSFKPYSPKTADLPADLEDLYKSCLVYYERLARFRLQT